MKKKAEITFLIFLLLFTVSCGDNHYSIRTKVPEPEIEIKRLERDLFSSDPASLSALKDSLQSKYGTFLQLFAYVVNAGNLNDSLAFNRLVDFATDRFNCELYETVISKYPDMSYYEKEFEEAWANYRYYFPDSLIPQIYTFISGFNNSVIVGDSVLGMGLDRYLGTGHRYYKELGIYNYQTLKMIPEKIVPDAFYAWAKAGWPDSSGESSGDLLSAMLYEGKLYYFTKCMLYEYPDSLIFGFTSDQMKFCKNNEYRMWEYLIEHDMLFSTDMMLIRKLTGEAPFTTYFTSESPGRACVWLGFRIIESYMKNKQEVELRHLMTDDKYRKILEEARYSPPG
ncbi:MAG: hypothetical protein U9N72_11090 [Bacteroidota bacterium]|nr:hypothetical protein [Bacteroidota bacterium]